MQLSIHHYHHIDEECKDLLLTIIKNQKRIMTDLTAMTTAVQNETTVDESAINLIEGLAAEITNAGTDPVALQSLVDSLNAEQSKLVAAITANTTAPVKSPAPVQPPVSDPSTGTNQPPVTTDPSTGISSGTTSGTAPAPAS